MDRTIDRLRRTFSRYDKLFKIIIGYVLPLVGIIMALFMPPPVSSFTNATFIKVIVAILVVVLVILLRLYSKRRYRTGWYITGAVSFVLFLSVYFVYANVKERYLLEYEGVTVIIGDQIAQESKGSIAELSRENGQKLDDGSSLHNSELLSYAGGFAIKVWTADSINRSTHLILFLFYFNLILFICLLAAALQSLQLTFSA